MDPMPGVLMCDALAADQGGEVEKGTSAPGCEKPAALLDWEIPRKHEPIKKVLDQSIDTRVTASAFCRGQLRHSLPPTDAGPGSLKSENFQNHPWER